jgi:hypothetical protein
MKSEGKKYLAKRARLGLQRTLLVDKGRDGQFRIYTWFGGTKKVYKPLKERFLTATAAQHFLDNYAKINRLVRCFKLDR